MIAMCIRAGIWVYLIGIHWDDKQTIDTFLSSKHGVDLSSKHVVVKPTSGDTSWDVMITWFSPQRSLDTPKCPMSLLGKPMIQYRI